MIDAGYNSGHMRRAQVNLEFLFHELRVISFLILFKSWLMQDTRAQVILEFLFH